MIMNDLQNNELETVLFDSHLLLNAKMVSYGGFIMPVSYPKGIQVEYFGIRNNVGIFDVSHMGEFQIMGDDALDFLQKMTINDVSKLNIGQAQYSAMCNNEGGIIDDLILYRTNYGFLMVVNAANIKKDYDWLKQHAFGDAQIHDISNEISLIAIQGPKSRNTLRQFTNVDLMMPFYSFQEGDVCGTPVMISRTGYTGELGFEIYGNSKSIKLIWDAFIGNGIMPAGLAARDILRMEMKYCLYGNDINEKFNPLEAGLGWVTVLGKNEFIGHGKIKSVNKVGLKKKLIAFKMEERGIARSGYEVYVEHKRIGFVTSGNFSPSLNIGIGLAYVEIPYDGMNQQINIKVRDKFLNARIIKPPFIEKTSLHD